MQNIVLLFFVVGLKIFFQVEACLRTVPCVRFTIQLFLRNQAFAYVFVCVKKNHHQKSKLSRFLCVCILFEYKDICVCVCVCVCVCLYAYQSHEASLSKQNEQNLRKPSIKFFSDSLGHQ